MSLWGPSTDSTHLASIDYFILPPNAAPHTTSESYSTTTATLSSSAPPWEALSSHLLGNGYLGDDGDSGAGLGGGGGGYGGGGDLEIAGRGFGGDAVFGGGSAPGAYLESRFKEQPVLLSGAGSFADPLAAAGLLAFLPAIGGSGSGSSNSDDGPGRGRGLKQPPPPRVNFSWVVPYAELSARYLLPPPLPRSHASAGAKGSRGPTGGATGGAAGGSSGAEAPTPGCYGDGDDDGGAAPPFLMLPLRTHQWHPEFDRVVARLLVGMDKHDERADRARRAQVRRLRDGDFGGSSASSSARGIGGGGDGRGGSCGPTVPAGSRPGALFLVVCAEWTLGEAAGDDDALARHDIFSAASPAPWEARLRVRLAGRLPSARRKSLLARVRWLPPVAALDYLSLLRHARAVLDPVPVSSAPAALDAFAVGTPLVSSPSSQRPGFRHGAALWRGLLDGCDALGPALATANKAWPLDSPLAGSRGRSYDGYDDSGGPHARDTAGSGTGGGGTCDGESGESDGSDDAGSSTAVCGAKARGKPDRSPMFTVAEDHADNHADDSAGDLRQRGGQTERTPRFTADSPSPPPPLSGAAAVAPPSRQSGEDQYRGLFPPLAEDGTGLAAAALRLATEPPLRAHLAAAAAACRPLLFGGPQPGGGGGGYGSDRFAEELRRFLRTAADAADRAGRLYPRNSRRQQP